MHLGLAFMVSPACYVQRQARRSQQNIDDRTRSLRLRLFSTIAPGPGPKVRLTRRRNNHSPKERRLVPVDLCNLAGLRDRDNLG